MRRTLHAGAILISLGCTLAAGAAYGAETDVSFRAGAGAGYDTNPLRLPGDVQVAGGFTELRLDTALDLDLSQRFGLYFDATALQRVHQASRDDGDYGLYGVKAAFDLVPYRGQQSYLSFAVGAQYGGQRLTYVDRATGQTYEVIEDPNNPVSTAIPERLDRDTTGAFVNLLWKANRRVRFYLNTLYQRHDYLEDYTESVVLDSLDHDRIAVSSEVRLIVHRQIRINLAVARSILDYEERPARDLRGSAVPGIFNEYQQTTFGISLDLLPSRDWQTGFGVNASAQDDIFAGYYDNEGRSIFAYLKNAIGPRTRWEFFTSFRQLDYENSTVDGDPTGALRRSNTVRVVGRFDRALNRVLNLFVEGGHQDSDNTDLLYAYDRDWGVAGLTYTY